MNAYYNENDPYAAQWLRNLIANKLIAYGDVDERSILDVKAIELVGYTQHHFFAGIGGWSYALRLAGWPDNKPVLTGSPPCQPFSMAGGRKGVKDERHLSPVWLQLVKTIRPAWVFGEQVAFAAKADAWLDDLLDALEEEGYAKGATVLPSCVVAAPHIRKRLWFVGRLADADGQRLQRDRLCRDKEENGQEPPSQRSGAVHESSHNVVQWDTYDWMYFGDGRWRPIEPGTFPLAHGVPARVGKLRAYGNAIVPQVAAEVIKAALNEESSNGKTSAFEAVNPGSNPGSSSCA